MGIVSTKPSGDAPPPALPQFAHIKRYWDPAIQAFAAKLLPGEYYVTEGGEAICTVLGSCISVCARDATRNIGGMNHFMLPLDRSKGQSSWGDAGSAATRYGNVAMERMINDMLKCGARRTDLQFKLIGGGKVLAAMTDVGATNIEFVRRFMKTEGLYVVGEDLGDIFPRKVQFFPDSGRVRVKRLASTVNNAIFARERSHLQDLTATPQAGDVELF